MSNAADEIELHSGRGFVSISVKAVPGASRTKIVGVWNKALRVAVTAPPEDGRANAELLAFLAEALGVKRRDVSITLGQTRKLKVIPVAGLQETVRREGLHAALA